MPIVAVHPTGAPHATGHYTPGLVYNGLVFVSGQGPEDPRTGQLAGTTIEAQTEQALRNVEAVLQAAGSSLSRVLQMTIYLTDISLWPGMNSTYTSVMGAHKPARAAIPVRDMLPGMLIEIQAVAAAG